MYQKLKCFNSQKKINWSLNFKGRLLWGYTRKEAGENAHKFEKLRTPHTYQVDILN